MQRNKRQAVFSLAALALLFLWAPAASPEERAFSLTLLAGIQSSVHFGSLVPLPQTADVPEVEVLLEHEQPAMGLSLGYRIGRHFELQGEALYDHTKIMNDIGIGLAGIPLGKTKASDAVLYSLSGCLLYNLNLRGFSPYAAVGIGAAVLDTEEFGSKTRPYLLVRAGVRIPLTDRLRAALDVRDSVTFFRFDRDFRVYYPLIYSLDFKGTQHSSGLFLGLSYVF